MLARTSIASRSCQDRDTRNSYARTHVILHIYARVMHAHLVAAAAAAHNVDAPKGKYCSTLISAQCRFAFFHV